MSKALRLFYAAGPGNVIGTYKYWIQGLDDLSQVSVTYSAQFYDVCDALDAQAYVISSWGESNFLQEGRFTIEHRPVPLPQASGILYHLSHLWYGLQLIVSAVRFRANFAVIADGTTYWFILSLLPWLGVQVIPSLHCLLWRQHIPQSTTEKWIFRLSRNLFAKYCAAILVVSDSISKQVAELTAGEHQPIMRSLPVYRKNQFAGIGEPDEDRSPFRVLFVGRIEPEKGVFDLLEIAKGFAAEGRKNISFALCGNGSMLDSLKLAAQEVGVDSFFVCYGHCNKQHMREMFSWAHVVIVPTKTDFREGFNKVVVEGILSGRPVVTSAVCPGLSVLQDAVVEVAPDNTKEYAQALVKLCDDREFYEQKRRGCLDLQEQFYDVSRSWGAKLKSILLAIQENRLVDTALSGNK
ncbi:MAG: glycosyltransferase family 4 protein [Symploca sp. SIO2E9]|nr:glycosyltransferase family 4 protein [Symploca sp. SIO2E9]